MIHVNRGATSLGAFPEEEVREGLRTGRFASSDLGWREGMPSWKPLSQFSEFAAAAPAAPPPEIGATSTSETVARAADCLGNTGKNVDLPTPLSRRSPWS